jgi:hypothetical protein
MTALFEQFNEWLKAYIPDDQERIGIVSFMNREAVKHVRIGVVVGFIIGIGFTIMLLKWLA